MTTSTWKATVSFLLDRDGPRCGICLKKLAESISIDHVIPISQGGPDLLSNFRLAHPRCNVSHFRKNFKSKRKPHSEEHKKKIGIANKKQWDEIRAGLRPHPRMHLMDVSSETRKEWWAKRSRKERKAIRQKAWETRRAGK